MRLDPEPATPRRRRRAMTGRRATVAATCFGVVLCGLVMGQMNRQYAQAEVAGGLHPRQHPREQPGGGEDAGTTPASIQEHRDHAAWVFDR